MGMTLYLQQIEEHFNSTYKPTWLKGSMTNRKLANVVKKISEFERQCLISFAQSILSGEYIIHPNEIKKIIETTKDAIQIDLDPLEKDDKKKSLYKRVADYTRMVSEMLNHYCELVADSEDRVNIFDYSLYSDTYHVKFNSDVNYADLYSLMLQLSYIDCFFEKKQQYIQILLHCREYLKEKYDSDSSIMALYDILLDKCLLLLKKLLFEGHSKTSYTINNKRANFDPQKAETKFFKNLENQFELYLKQEYDSKEEEMQVLEEKLNKAPNSLTFGEMMLLLKFYKDYHRTSQGHVRKLILLFEEKNKDYEKKHDVIFDDFCINTLRHYVINCKLSFDIKQGECLKNGISIDALETLINDVGELELQTKIHNFYPYRKIICYLKSKIINKEINEAEIDRIKAFLQKLDNELRLSIKWCDERSFFPIFLPYSECLTSIDGWGAPIYTPSSFCRPINYKDILDEYQNLHLEIVVAYNKLDMQQEHLNIESVRSDYKDALGKNLETMSIFSAIIAFLFGCVNFLTMSGRIENVTTSSLLLDVVVLGVILLLFANMVLVWTMSRGNTWKEFLCQLRGRLFLYSTIIYIVILIFSIILCVNTQRLVIDNARPIQKPKCIKSDRNASRKLSCMFKF